MDLFAAFLPEGISPSVAIFLVAASACTSAMTAGFGIGGGVLMLALLGFWLPFSALIPVHAAIQLGSNTGRAWVQRPFVRRDIILPYLIGGICGAVVASFFVVDLPEDLMLVVLGVVLLIIVWIRFPALEKLSRLALGLVSAVISVAAILIGVTGPALVSILAKMMPGDRKGLVATTAAAQVIQHFLKIAVFGFAGFAFAQWLPLVLAMIASGYAGTVGGSVLLDRMPQEGFEKWFKIIMSLLAADMVRRGLMQMS